jgi:hypothetical protein
VLDLPDGSDLDGRVEDAPGPGKGHEEFGCSISAMDDWVDLVNP